jgi:thiol-disulfide isomerase/thioredoxin
MITVGIEALRIGPLVLAWPRLFALLAAVVVVVAAERVAKRVDRGLGGWGWGAVLAGAVAGRLGYGLAHWSDFAPAPWRLLAVWQGGMLPVAAVAGAAAFGLWRLRGRGGRQALALVPVAAGLGVWLLLTAGRVWLVPADDVRLPVGERPTLAGEAVLAPAGRPAVVNLWASWCPPCRREMPRLARAAERTPAVAFAFVNQGEARAKVAAFAERFELPPERVFLDPAGGMSRRLGTVGLPATLFFDRSGRLAGAHVGEIARPALNDWLQRLIRRQP